MKATAATPVETTSMESSTEAGLSTRGKTSGGSAMVKAAEGSRVYPALGMRSRESMLRGPVETRIAAVKSTGMIEVVTIDKDSAVRFVVVVVEANVVMMPVISPMVPSPTEPAKEANSKTEAKRDSRSFQIQSRIPIPARPHTDGTPIDQPRIILRHVNNFGVRGLDHNSLPLRAHFFLRCAL
jgi:hypothetical protein